MRYAAVAAALLATVTAGCDKPAAAPAADTALPAAVPGKDWLNTVAATPEGGFRVGNPDAKVKLVEYASLTCPHCADFHAEATAPLRSKYVASGNVSYEYRNFLLNGPDYAASLLARCEGPATFFNLMSAFYENQPQWTEPFAKLGEADSKRLAALPQDQQIAALAKTGGLDAFMRARGMTAAKFEQCLSDPNAIKRLAAMRDEASTKLAVDRTPTFFVNGVKQDEASTWPQLEPRLQTALR